LAFCNNICIGSSDLDERPFFFYALTFLNIHKVSSLHDPVSKVGCSTMRVPVSRATVAIHIIVLCCFGVSLGIDMVVAFTVKGTVGTTSGVNRTFVPRFANKTFHYTVGMYSYSYDDGILHQRTECESLQKEKVTDGAMATLVLATTCAFGLLLHHQPTKGSIALHALLIASAVATLTVWGVHDWTLCQPPLNVTQYEPLVKQNQTLAWYVTKHDRMFNPSFWLVLATLPLMVVSLAIEVYRSRYWRYAEI
jgi:hypothetical protein